MDAVTLHSHMVSLAVKPGGPLVRFQLMRPPVRFQLMRPPVRFQLMRPPIRFQLMRPLVRFQLMRPPVRFQLMRPPVRFRFQLMRPLVRFQLTHFDIAQSDCRQARAKRRAHAPKSMASVAAREKMVPAPPHPYGRRQCVSVAYTGIEKSPSCSFSSEYIIGGNGMRAGGIVRWDRGMGRRDGVAGWDPR